MRSRRLTSPKWSRSISRSTESAHCPAAPNLTAPIVAILKAESRTDTRTGASPRHPQAPTVRECPGVRLAAMGYYRMGGVRDLNRESLGKGFPRPETAIFVFDHESTPAHGIRQCRRRLNSTIDKLHISTHGFQRFHPAAWITIGPGGIQIYFHASWETAPSPSSGRKPSDNAREAAARLRAPMSISASGQM